MHAISYSQEIDTGRYSEPYFEDEAFCELGFSFESAVSEPPFLSACIRV
jgi:hypothetical protein